MKTMPISEQSLTALCQLMGYVLKIDPQEMRMEGQVCISITTPEATTISDDFADGSYSNPRHHHFFKSVERALAGIATIEK